MLIYYNVFHDIKSVKCIMKLKKKLKKKFHLERILILLYHHCLRHHHHYRYYYYHHFVVIIHIFVCSSLAICNTTQTVTYGLDQDI